MASEKKGAVYAGTALDSRTEKGGDAIYGGAWALDARWDRCSRRRDIVFVPAGSAAGGLKL